MPWILRAFALAFTVLTAHIAAWLHHPATAAKTPQPALISNVSENESLVERRDQLRNRLDLIEARRHRPAPVALPATGAVVAPRPVRYTGSIPQIIQQAFAPLGS